MPEAEAVQEEAEDSSKDVKEYDPGEVKINKITCKGFKSFQQKTAVPFYEGLTAIVGENGNGKCVTGDTEVQTSDGGCRPVQEIVEEAMESEHIEKIDDGYVSYDTETQVQSLNPKTLEVESREVLACAKREAPDNINMIQTQSGRKIKATDDHPLFKLEEGQVRAVDSEDIKEGERIAVPRQLNLKQNGKIFTELLDLIDEGDSIYVPFRSQFKSIIYGLKEEKNATWKELAEDIGVSYNTLRGIKDEQSCEFSKLVRILRYSGMSDEEIVQQLENVTAKNYNKEVRIPWKNSPEFSKMLGYLLAEGRTDDEANQLWFTNENEKIIDEYVELAENQLGVKPTKKDYSANCWDAIVFRKTVSKIMQKFGIHRNGTGEKTIPSFYMKNAGEKEIKALLEGLYAGDGTVSHVHLSLTTKSKNLAEKVQNLLLRIGITSRVNERNKTATNSEHKGGTYYDLRVSGARETAKAAEKLNIPVKRKQEKLKHLAEKDHNPNFDLMEANDLVRKISEEQDLQITKLKEEHSRLASYCYDQCTPSRDGLQELVSEVFKHGEKTKNVEKLEKLVKSDIYWDEVEKTEKIEFEDEWVYDLNVAVGHNFVAQNMFVHNSNLIDAASFVFGKRSSQLRAKKLTQLIFNGGEGGKPADHAIVRIKLDNSSGIFDQFLEEEDEADEVEVARKVTQAGSSIYKFQGSNCKASKIDAIADKANIDPDGYHFVKQNRVTEIVEDSPTKRRNVIDELSGVAEFDEKKDEAEEELEEVEHKLQEQEILLEEKKEYLDKLKEEKELALKYRELEERKKKIKASVLEVRKRALSNQLANLNTNVGDKEERLEELKEKLEEIDNKIERKQDRVEEIEGKQGGDNDIQHLENKIEKKKGKIENKREKVEDLEETIEELEKMQSRKKTGSKAVNAVLSLEDDRIYGAFQDLISVEEDHAVAIETAAGARMKNVVCENKNAATDAINYLKRENIGRATMLPLDKVSNRSKSAKSKMAKKKKGVIDYAENLVNYDQKYEKAVKHVFSDTLIAEDLDSVKDIDGIRVVTLDGDIMRKGGSMTGGKKKKKRGNSKKLQSSLDPEKKKEEKEKVEKEIEDLQKDVAELKQMKRKREEDEETDEELQNEKQKLRDQLKELRDERQEMYSEQQKLKTKVEDERSKKPKLKAELENVKEEIEEHEYNEEELQLDQSPEELKDEKKRLVGKQNQLEPVNMRSIEEYKEKKEEYDEFQDKVSEIRQEKLEIEDMIEEVEKKKRECFMETFNEINSSFKEIFTDLFGGGTGELNIEDDDIEKGLEIKAQPPGKEPHIIDSLSGGEKTMTAIAFVFAILEYEESPFYFMDEIDAALDKTNSKKLSELLKDYADENQFIVISHNDITVRHAERAYGVSMRDGVSKIRSIELEE